LFLQPFVKVVKNKAYFKRFQTKFRRRREGRTDYRQRHKLITQDKNKYQSAKYRLVVRFSNKFVNVQVVSAEIIGDKVICAANSKELQRFDDRLTMGLKNYAAAYATGLLCARRLLKKVGLDDMYKGNEEPDGEVKTCEGENGRTYYVEEVDEESGRRPFRCLLDVGIKNTTTGCKIFGAMKGASDGGLDIPHSNKRFPGYNRDTKAYDAEVHKAHIFGEHVADYMKEMEEDDEENFKKHFAAYLDADISADDMEEVYEKLHAAIREDPAAAEKKPFKGIDKSYKKGIKKTYAQRKSDSNAKKANLQSGESGDAEDEEDDE
jgi:large subunit ribosomal protein L5e